MKLIISRMLLVLFGILLFSSCRTEDDVIIDPPIDEAIQANSKIADLMTRTALKDGSNDNIIDRASCLSIALPVNLMVNGIELTVNSDDGYQEIEDILDLFDDDIDTIVITYPITVIRTDYSSVVVNSESELEALSASCVDENELDLDIECIDFEYPISISIFDENSELVDTITINSDMELYEFVNDLDRYAAVTINFPISVIFSDGTVQSVSTIQELEDVIETADNSCDEDDDYDYNDDDCENCSTDALSELLANCSDWFVDKLEINDNDLDENYTDYHFNFSSDGSIDIEENGNTTSGTWSASGSGENITVVIEIAGLDDFNGSWTLHEIQEEPGEYKIDLRKQNDDRLRFESTCN